MSFVCLFFCLCACFVLCMFACLFARLPVGLLALLVCLLVLLACLLSCKRVCFLARLFVWLFVCSLARSFARSFVRALWLVVLPHLEVHLSFKSSVATELHSHWVLFTRTQDSACTFHGMFSPMESLTSWQLPSATAILRADRPMLRKSAGSWRHE